MSSSGVWREISIHNDSLDSLKELLSVKTPRTKRMYNQGMGWVGLNLVVICKPTCSYPSKLSARIPKAQTPKISKKDGALWTYAFDA